jgi:hypothetical protein
MARRTGIAAALLLVFVASAAGASASVPVRVTPPAGDASTTFVVSFTAPTTTGVVGSTRIRNEVVAVSRSVSAGCRSNETRFAPNVRRGARVRVGLVGPGWCSGTFSGKVIELRSMVCPPGSMCPAYIRMRTLGTFSFSVR